MAKRRGLSLQDIFRGPGSDDPARDGLKSKLAAAAGYVLRGDGAKRKEEAAELKRLLDDLKQLEARWKDSKVREVAQARAAIEVAIKQVTDGFTRLSGEDIE